MPEKGNNQDKVQDALLRIEAGIEAIHDSSSYKEYLRFVSRMHEYSFNNIMLIKSQFPTASRVAGYRKWQEVGRQVQKGEKGISILYPMFTTVQELDDKTGEQRKEQMITGYGVGYVFDVSQTSGEPLPDSPVAKALKDRPEEVDRARMLGGYVMEYLEEDGVSVEVERMPYEGIHGYYNPAKKHIGIGAHLGLVHACKTLVHETAHHVDTDRSTSRKSEREVVAEGTAFVVLDHHDIDTSDYSFPYVAAWAGKKDVLRANLDRIQKVSTTIFSGIDRVAERIQQEQGMVPILT